MICILTCLAFACPCGMNTVVFPAAYGQDTRPGAGLTMVTSTLAVITIPILMALMNV
jgi:predicted permease